MQVIDVDVTSEPLEPKEEPKRKKPPKRGDVYGEATPLPRVPGKEEPIINSLGEPAELVEFPVEIVSIDTLIPHPRNYRIHPEDQVEHLIESIKEHGLYRPIVVAEDYTILAGHGVVVAARQMGLERIPIRRLPIHPDDPRALKLLTGDNEISHLGEVDDRALTEILKHIKEEDEMGLLGTGYDDKMLANLVFVTRPASELADFDAAAEWVGMPTYEQGKAVIKLVLSFESEEDRAELMELLHLRKSGGNGNTWSATWPPTGINDLTSLKFEVKP